jgi:hypothetical protein
MATDDLGAVFIDEVLGKNCLVTYETYKGTCENVHVGCIPGVTRDQVWRAHLIDYTNADEPFMKRWQTIYHNPWPFTNIGVHPALEEPYKRWTEFQEQWVQHCWESEARAVSGADMLAVSGMMAKKRALRNTESDAGVHSVRGSHRSPQRVFLPQQPAAQPASRQHARPAPVLPRSVASQVKPSSLVVVVRRVVVVASSSEVHSAPVGSCHQLVPRACRR